MFITILLPSILALFALYKNKLTIPAVILAWLMAIVITYCSGIYSFIALAITFFLTIISDKIKKKDKDEKRNSYQIISNVLTATFCTVLFYFKKNEMFIVMFYSVISGSLADTLASSIGSLAKGKSINPLTFRQMKKGESGAVSSLGISASFIGGLIIGAIYYLNGGYITNYLVIILMGFLGSYSDSVMGAHIQSKYECPKCKKQVESKIHCGKDTKLLKGMSFVNNDVVNLLSNIIVFITTYIIELNI